MHIKTALIAVSTLAFVACDDAATDATAPSTQLAVEQAAPPGAGGLDLTIDGVLQPGNQVTFFVQGAQPNETVFLARGVAESPGALCPNPLNGLCVDVQNPKLLTTITSNAAGNAQFNLTVPNAVPEGAVAWFQAATGGATAATSNVVPKFNPRDTGAVMAVDLLELATVVPGTSYDGQRNEIYYSVFNGLDVCWLASPTTSTTPLTTCTGCDFAFDIGFGTFTDESVSGDCIDLLGLDPATINAGNQSWGYDSDYYFQGYGNYPAAMFYDTTTAAWEPASVSVYYGGGDFQWLIEGSTYYVY